MTDNDIAEIEKLFDIADSKERTDVPSDASFEERITELDDELVSSDVAEGKMLEVTHEMAKDDAPPGVIEEEPKKVTVPGALKDAVIRETTSNTEPEPEPEPELSPAFSEKRKTVPSDGSPWQLHSPSDKFDRFYEEKSKMVHHMLVDGIVPFDSYREELKNSSVDISVLTFDLNELCNRMQLVHGFKDRIKQIQIHCNAQFFLWERGVQLMHGLLARVEYDKPAARQDGVIYEHMQDMEMYFAKLKSITKSAEGVMKTLDSAADCLSRQVTIALPMRPVERYEHSENTQALLPSPPAPKLPAVPKPKLDDYDGLGDSPSTKTIKEDKPNKGKGSRSVSWGDI